MSVCFSVMECYLGHMALILAEAGRFLVFNASLVCLVSSRQARTVHQDPISKVKVDILD